MGDEGLSELLATSEDLSGLEKKKQKPVAREVQDPADDGLVRVYVHVHVGVDVCVCVQLIYTLPSTHFAG
jgi:hypothetical protein